MVLFVYNRRFNVLLIKFSQNFCNFCIRTKLNSFLIETFSEEAGDFSLFLNFFRFEWVRKFRNYISLAAFFFGNGRSKDVSASERRIGIRNKKSGVLLQWPSEEYIISIRIIEKVMIKEKVFYQFRRIFIWKYFLYLLSLLHFNTTNIK